MSVHVIYYEKRGKKSVLLMCLTVILKPIGYLLLGQQYLLMQLAQNSLLIGDKIINKYTEKFKTKYEENNVQ